MISIELHRHCIILKVLFKNRINVYCVLYVTINQSINQSINYLFVTTYLHTT